MNNANNKNNVHVYVDFLGKWAPPGVRFKCLQGLINVEENVTIKYIPSVFLLFIPASDINFLLLVFWFSKRPERKEKSLKSIFIAVIRVYEVMKC